MITHNNMITVRYLLFFISYLAASRQEDVTETEVPGFKFEKGAYDLHLLEPLLLKNISSRNGELYLRNGLENHALVGWKNRSEVSEWSFTISFNELDLGGGERAGLYLRYSKERPEIGVFKGGPSKFNGIVAGIEFEGKKCELAFAHNEGKDYAGQDIFVTLTDSIAPIRLKGITELDMKVISTKKNLKIELYDGDRLIYDGFRLLEPETDQLRAYEPGGYFSITTIYHDVSSSKAFSLKRAVLHRRIESDSYDPHLRKASLPEVRERERHEIQHPNADIQDLVHKVEGLMLFLRHTFGDIASNILVRGQEMLDKELMSLKEKIGRYITMTTANKEEISGLGELNKLETKLKQLKRNLNELSYMATRHVERQEIPFTKYLTLVVGSGVLSVLLYKEMKHLSLRKVRK